MTKPIKPAEAGAKKLSSIPDVVIEAFNTLIVKHWDGDQATFTQAEVAALIIANAPLLKERLYVERMLDIERLFEAEGWSVEYATTITPRSSTTSMR
jgi:hypothetical protein